MPAITAHDGNELYFETHGRGPTLMMYVSPRPPMGPLGSLSRRLAATFIEELSDRFRLVFIDYPGTAKPDTLTPSNVTPTFSPWRTRSTRSSSDGGDTRGAG